MVNVLAFSKKKDTVNGEKNLARAESMGLEMKLWKRFLEKTD